MCAVVSYASFLSCNGMYLKKTDLYKKREKKGGGERERSETITIVVAT